jgi:hypothetical protein
MTVDPGSVLVMNYRRCQLKLSSKDERNLSFFKAIIKSFSSHFKSLIAFYFSWRVQITILPTYFVHTTMLAGASNFNNDGSGHGGGLYDMLSGLNAQVSAAADSALIAGVDRHGLKNILAEKFVNVQFDRAKSGAEIQGCTVNNLLRGLFFINGNSLFLTQRMTALDLPGGISCWDDILETTYINLSSLLTAQEFNSRFLVLCKLFVSSPSVVYAHMLSGAIVFTFTWTSKFNGYLSREQLHELRQGVAECVSILTPHTNTHQAAIRPTNTQSQQPLTVQMMHHYVYMAVLQLNDMLDHLSDDRHCLVRGLQPSPARWAQQAVIRTLQHPPTHAHANTQHSTTSASTSNALLYNTSHYVWNPRAVLTLPSVPAVIGSQEFVSTASADRRHTLKQEFAKLAAAAATSSDSIGLFGASAMLQNFSDSDEDNDDEGNLSFTRRRLSMENAVAAGGGNATNTDPFANTQANSGDLSNALASLSLTNTALPPPQPNTEADNIYNYDPHLSQTLGHRKNFQCSLVCFDDSVNVHIAGSTNTQPQANNGNSSNPNANASTHTNTGADPFHVVNHTIHNAPIRMPATFNLVQDADKYLSNNTNKHDMWVFDTLELARQWTLIDHNMFIDIPLTAFMGELTWTRPRHRADAGAAAIRRFVYCIV